MPKIAIDIDNTICNTTDFFWSLAILYDRNTLHKQSKIDFSKVVPRSNEWNQEELKYYIENIFNKEAINIPLKKDVPFYINKLKKMGYEIIFLTNRGLKDDDHTDLIVEEYLNKYQILYDRIETKVKDKYLYLEDGDYFIDDSIQNCEQALEKTHCKVIMINSDQTKNYYNANIYRVNEWNEIYEYIIKNG